MARAIFPHEMSDPDFEWLISNFKETRPAYFTVEGACLPMILIPAEISELEKNSKENATAVAGLDGSHLSEEHEDLSDEPEVI